MVNLKHSSTNLSGQKLSACESTTMDFYRLNCGTTSVPYEIGRNKI